MTYIKRVTVFLVLLTFFINVRAFAIPGWIVEPALKFISNPDDVFYNFHLDNVDYTPVLESKRATLRTNFLTSFLPLTWGNLNLKIKILSDRSYYDWMPQIDITSNYGRIIALDIISAVMADSSTDTFKPPTMKDYNIGLLFTKPVSEETRLYAGFNYSVVEMNFEFPEPFEITSETTLSELNIMRRDYILVTGITNILADDKRIVAYVGYGFKYKKIFSRFSWHYNHLEIGFNIYPEGLLVIHPFLGWHWNF